jgi:Xaa-Pro aminopeptidase
VPGVSGLHGGYRPHDGDGEAERRTALKIIDLAYRAFEASIAKLKAGNTVGQVRSAMRSVVDGSGYERNFMGPGHGLGLNDDCYPFFGNPADAGFVFADGMTMSVEVGAMVAGLGGVRYEDNFIINGSEPLRLTHAERLVTISV